MKEFNKIQKLLLCRGRLGRYFIACKDHTCICGDTTPTEPGEPTIDEPGIPGNLPPTALFSVVLTRAFGGAPIILELQNFTSRDYSDPEGDPPYFFKALSYPVELEGKLFEGDGTPIVAQVPFYMGSLIAEDVVISVTVEGLPIGIYPIIYQIRDAGSGQFGVVTGTLTINITA